MLRPTCNPKKLRNASGFPPRCGPRLASKATVALAIAGLFAAPARAADLTYLRCLVSQTPAGGWVQASVGPYSAAWASTAQGGLPEGSYSHPAAVVRAWSSVAWDSARGNLILWGGGHANYIGNEVYLWQGSTGRWTRGSLPTRIEQYANTSTFLPSDNATPQTSHTYDNNLYLPINDRFVTFGGAAFNSGGAFVLRDSSGVPVVSGPWVWDPSKADANKTGGADGSGYLGSTPGGRMWSNQRGRWVGGGNPYGHVGTHSAYRSEGGKDVVYVTGDAYGSGWQPLYRYELGNLALGQPGAFHMVGVSSSAPTSQGTATIDTRNNLYVHTSAIGGWQGLGVWDLSTLPRVNGAVTDCSQGSQGPDRCLVDRYVVLVDATGAQVPVNTQHGIGYDAASGKILLWDGTNGGTVWETQPQYLSNGSLSPRWQVVAHPSTTTAQPQARFVAGVLGKWQYVSELKAFIALDEYDWNRGDAAVWLYKPVGSTNLLDVLGQLLPRDCRALVP